MLPPALDARALRIPAWFLPVQQLAADGVPGPVEGLATARGSHGLAGLRSLSLLWRLPQLPAGSPAPLIESRFRAPRLGSWLVWPR